jgi:hypothetical protein
MYQRAELGRIPGLPIFLLAWLFEWFTTVVCRNLSSSIPFFLWIVVQYQQSEMEKAIMDIADLAG